MLAFLLHQVTATFAQQHTHTLYITIDGETIHTTDEHPFLNTDGAWVNAQDLQVGNEIVSADGDVGIVEAVERIDEPQMMYNLSVAVVATYLVGTGKWVVHNVDWPFTIDGSTLFIGEGNFSFSASIASQISDPSRITATDFYTEISPAQQGLYDASIATLINSGATVIPSGVDATQLHTMPEFDNARFKTVMVNFPFMDNMRATRLILQGMFKSLGNNKNNVIDPSARVIINHKAKGYNGLGLANETPHVGGFYRIGRPTKTPIDVWRVMFEGYEHTRTRVSSQFPDIQVVHTQQFCR